jgi:hypothetical protein
MRLRARDAPSEVEIRVAQNEGQLAFHLQRSRSINAKTSALKPTEQTSGNFDCRRNRKNHQNHGKPDEDLTSLSAAGDILTPLNGEAAQWRLVWSAATQ